MMDDFYRLNHREAYRVIVAGGRDFNDYEFMKEKLDELFFASDEFLPCERPKAGYDTISIRLYRVWRTVRTRLPCAMPMSMK